MKSMILTALLLVGFSVSAQSVCQVSSDTAQSIDAINNSSMMAKPKANVIRSMIDTDDCLAMYLTAGDAAQLARAITELKVISSAEILSSFVSQADLKMRTAKTCQVAADTVFRVEQFASLGMHVKARYATVKGLLVEDECLSLELSQSEISALSQRIVFGSADSLTIELLISEALAH